MKSTLLFIKDYGNTYPVILSAPDHIDIKDAFFAACNDAANDGIRFSSPHIPDKYLLKHHLKRENLPVMELQIHHYGQTPSEAGGVSYPTCRNCNSFEDGSCYRYGGICNPDDEEDCIHSESIYQLTYESDEHPFQCHVDITDEIAEKDNPILDILPLLLSNKDNTSKTIQELIDSKDYDAAFWKLSKTT